MATSRKTGLGKGLNALFSANAEEKEEIKERNLGDIEGEKIDLGSYSDMGIPKLGASLSLTFLGMTVLYSINDVKRI